MKKPKPPKSIGDVRNYVRNKNLNVNWNTFWDYFEAGEWHDGTGKPVLSWKQKLITWHYKDKRTIAAAKAKKNSGRSQETYERRIRSEYKEYLEGKTTQALKDLKTDGGQISNVCGWLIDEILAERKGKL